MDGIFFRPKVENKIDFKKEIEQVLETEQDNFPVLVQYGMQHSYTIGVSKPIKSFLHTYTSRAHNFIVHYGAGVNNRIAAWTQNLSELRPRKLVKGNRIGYGILKMIYIANNFVYVAACTDLRLRILGAKLEEYSALQMSYTILDMIYWEHRNVFIISTAGFINVFKLGLCLHDPPYLEKEICLPLMNGEVAWPHQLNLDTKRNELLAVCHQGLIFISTDSDDDLCCKNVLENRLSSSVTCATLYPPSNYVLTGHKDGSIKTWNTTMQRFPLFGSFLGHTKEILFLATHWTEPLLFSSSLDQTIRIWNIETFLEAYRFSALEPIISFKLIGPATILYSTLQHIKVFDLNLFFTLFTNVGARALRLSRVSGKRLPTRIVYVGGDGGVRLISPIHGSVLSMTFPIINQQLIDVLHDVRANAMYVLLANGNVMVFSTKTNPCSTVELWAAHNFDDRICSVEILESALLVKNKVTAIKQSSLLFGGHVSGHISLLKGKDFHLVPHKAHQGRVTMLKSRKYERHVEEGLTANLVSYGSDNMLIIWNVQSGTDEFSKNDFNLAMIMIMRIDMVNTPMDVILVGNVFTMITQQSLFMYNMANIDCNVAANSYNQNEFMVNCSIQEHFGNITQMCACETLCIIATCGKDCQVKIWDTNNNLIRELSFDEEVQGVCFSNDRGDLMIGLQSNLYYVPAWKYLTPFYLKMLLDMDIEDDENEKCISFNQLLKFWYDDSWVNTIPVGSTNVDKPCKLGKISIGLNEDEYQRLRKFLFLTSKQEEELEENCMNLDEQKHARRRSTIANVYALDVSSLMNKIPKTRYNNSMQPLLQSGVSIEKNLEIATKGDASKIDIMVAEEENEGLSSILEDVIITKSSKEIADLISKEDENHTDDSETVDRLSAKETLLRIYWPCAPDGFIPNSVIRGTVKPSPPKDNTDLIKQLEEEEANSARFKKLLFDITMLPKLTKSDSKFELQPAPKNEVRYEELQRGETEFVWSSEESDVEDVDDSRTESVVDEHFIDNENRENIDDTPEVTAENKIKKDRSMNRKKTARRMSMLSEKDIKSKKPQPKQNEVKSSVVRKNQNKEKSYDENKIVDLKDECVKPDQNSKDQKQKSIHEIFRRRMTKPWFPKDIPADVPMIVKDLFGKLETANALEVQDITALLLEIQSHIGMSTPVLDELLGTLKKLSSCKTTAIKHSAVKAIIELGEKRKDIVVQLIELLSDQARIIREEAKHGLQCLAGIEDFESLVSAMQELNLLKEEAMHFTSKDIENIKEFQLEKRKSVELADGEENRHCQGNIEQWLSREENDSMDDSNEGFLKDKGSSYSNIENYIFDHETESGNKIKNVWGESILSKTEREDPIFKHPAAQSTTASCSTGGNKDENNMEQVAASIAPKLFNKFEQYKVDTDHYLYGSQNEPDESTRNRSAMTSSAAVKVDDFLNKLYSSIGSSTVANDKQTDVPNINVSNGSRNETNHEKSDVDFTATKNDTSLKIDDFSNQRYPGICSSTVANDRKKRVSNTSVSKEEAQTNKEKLEKSNIKGNPNEEKRKRKVDKEIEQKNHIQSLLYEVTMYALFMERVASKNGYKVISEEMWKGLISLVEVVQRSDIDIKKISSQVIWFIKTLKLELQAANLVSMNLTTKQLPDQRVAGIKYDYTYTKVHRQQLIQSPICRSMVRGIRGERIAKTVEVAQFGNSSNTEKLEHQIFGIPERLGSYAVADDGRCKFGKMTMSWTSKAPSYDMNLTLLNEQRIRPLKLYKRPTLFDQTFLSRKKKQKLVLPSLVKKRMGDNGSIFSRKSRRLRSKESNTEIVKLPFLASNIDIKSNRSNSSVSIQSDFYHNFKSNDSAVQPPPPPNTADLV